MQPDALRGTPLFKYSNLTAESVCACSHIFGYHQMRGYNGSGNDVNLACTYCSCIAFTTYDERERMSNAATKSAEQNGLETGRRLSAVFVLRDDATYQAKIDLGMSYANREGLSLENGAAFVTGFINGLDARGKRSAESLTLEEKIDLLLNREIDKRLGSGDDSGGNAGTTPPSA